MKAIMFVEKGQAAIIEEPKPMCQPDTMLVKTLYAGLSNGTERMFWVGGNYGDGIPWPKRLAYQHVSEVVECGPDISNFQLGDVVFSSTFPGHVEYHLRQESDLVVKLLKGFDLIAGAQLGVAAVSYHDAQRARVQADANVLVLGDGLIGQFAAQAARAIGAKVTLAGHRQDRLDIAKRLGLEHVINNSDAVERNAVKERSPFSVIFECSAGDVLDEIIGLAGQPGLVGPGSRARLVMVAGRYEVNYNFNMAGMAELDIIHTQHFDQPDLEAVVDLVVKGEIQIRPLIHDVILFSDAVEIFKTLRDHPRQLLGTVFVMPDTDF